MSALTAAVLDYIDGQIETMQEILDRMHTPITRQALATRIARLEEWRAVASGSAAR